MLSLINTILKQFTSFSVAGSNLQFSNYPITTIQVL
jgi:hypothetical protein